MYLTVPLVDDMVQIGLGGQYRTGIIEVCKSRAALTVIRTDGAPLQAQIVRDGARITVLREPVPQLQLTRVGPAVWLVRGGVPVGAGGRSGATGADGGHFRCGQTAPG